MSDVTRILTAIEQGDQHAAEELLPLVYDELRKLAAQKMAQESPGQTLQATALVNDAYLRLVASPVASAPVELDSLRPIRSQQWNSQGHFFAAAAEAMRRSHSQQQLARSHGHLGLVLGQTGRFAEAEQNLRKAVQVREKAAAIVHDRPEVWQEVALAYRHLGCLLASSGQPQEAENAYSRARALDLMGKVLDELPAMANYRLQQAMTQKDLGNLHTSTGEDEKAKLLFQQALLGFRRSCEMRPDDPESQNYLARFLTTCPAVSFRDPAQAVALAEKAVATAPQDGAHWTTLGMAQYRAGAWKAAALALEKSMTLRPAGSGIFFLAMAHGHLGHQDEACNWYDRAVHWVEKNERLDEEVRRFRAEAAAVLKRTEPPKKGTIKSKNEAESLSKK